jgi:hypothetical protein
MLVKPGALTVAKGSPDGLGENDQRWSFLWSPPRGDFCPECEFPLSKYFGRLKWIRTMVVGVAIVLAALFLQIVGSVGRFGHTYIEIMRIVVIVGAIVAAVGIVGVLIGGRHGRVRVTGGP